MLTDHSDPVWYHKIRIRGCHDRIAAWQRHWAC